MSQIGVPGLLYNRRMTQRMPTNPMDRCTVVSIFPKDIDEHKVTLSPGRFMIPAGTFENPSVLVVGSSSWWRELDEEQPLLEIPNSSLQVAESIVKDYCNGMLAYDKATMSAGLFFTPGVFTAKTIKSEHPELLMEAKVKQDRWYTALVKMADILWAKSNGNPIVISDEMRLAARSTGLTQKDWMKDFTMMQNVKCIACGQPKDPQFPVCPHCHAINDMKKAEELGIVFAKMG